MRLLREEYLAKRIKPLGDGSFQDLLAFPSHFEIETINACNARCPMCTINEWDKEEKLMKDELFEKIIIEIAENRLYVKRVNLYRDGEPLLDTKLAQRVRRCKELKIPNISISTNVSLLDGQRAEELLAAGIDMITLSIDSLEPDIYQSIRRGLHFETVISNAKNLLRLRNDLNSECQIWIRMIRQESNINEFTDYKAFWESTDLVDPIKDRVYYHNIFDWGGQLDGFKAVARNTEEHLPCVALWSLMPIFANGDVPMCNVDFNCTNKVGNVRENTIKSIWENSQINRIREKHLTGKKADIEMCRSCNVWEEVSQRDGTPSVSSQYAISLSVTPTEA
jgi:radical SAM protein with 4Fe4S-binding SPASM domain